MSDGRMQPYASEEAQLLRESVLRWAQETASAERCIAAREAGPGAALRQWRELADRGWLGVGVPEASGGFNGAVQDLGVVMEGIGRALTHDPYLATVVLAAQLIERLGSDAQREALASLVGGEQTYALAHFEPELGYSRGPVATRSANGRLTGRKSFVFQGPGAGMLIVSARDEAGALGLYLVSPSAQGLEIVPYPTVDGRWSADLRLADVAGERLGDGGDAAETLDWVLDMAVVALGWEAVGAMTSVIDATNAYLKTRKQFGQTLDNFQVLRHRLVDMYIHAEETKAQLESAAEALDLDDPAERRAAISACKVQMCRAARFVGQNGVQLHGGMGMTDELMISHYFKRLMMVEALFGNADFHLRRFEEAILPAA